MCVNPEDEIGVCNLEEETEMCKRITVAVVQCRQLMVCLLFVRGGSAPSTEYQAVAGSGVNGGMWSPELSIVTRRGLWCVEHGISPLGVVGPGDLGGLSFTRLFPGCTRY